ncbi:MAG TPA: hypothetical protein VMW69_07325 [Spirochaetia bacterium]|nr:hypothetical protein [Spirochaetia bacterium]
MKPKRAGLMLLLMAIAVSWSFGQSLTTSYAQGDVEVQSGSGWKPVTIGDTVAVGGMLRMAAGAYVELSGSGGIDITLSEPGTYSMTSLLSSARRMKGTGYDSVLVNAFAALAGGTSSVQSSAMGVRGANESASTQPQWVTSDAQVFIDAAKSFIQSGAYPKAIDQLKLALDSASDSELPTVHYYLAEVYSLNGNLRDSLKEISQVKPSGSEDWYADYAILRAKLLVDSYAFAQEVAWLKLKQNDLSQDAQRSAVYYFSLALGYRGLGNKADEQRDLTEVTRISAGTNLARSASRLLASL